MPFANYLAETSQLGNLLHALGINGTTLLFNITAFLLVIAILTQFVYPTLIKSTGRQKI